MCHSTTGLYGWRGRGGRRQSYRYLVAAEPVIGIGQVPADS
jgi:hypothetical protein